MMSIQSQLDMLHTFQIGLMLHKLRILLQMLLIEKAALCLKTHCSKVVGMQAYYIIHYHTVKGHQ